MESTLYAEVFTSTAIYSTTAVGSRNFSQQTDGEVPSTIALHQSTIRSQASVMSGLFSLDARLAYFRVIHGLGLLDWVWLGPTFPTCNGSGWVGSVSWWVGLDRVTQNGPMDNSGLARKPRARFTKHLTIYHKIIRNASKDQLTTVTYDVLRFLLGMP